MTGFIALFRERSNVKQLIGDDYLDRSSKYQAYVSQYLDKIGLSKSQDFSDYIATLLIDSQIPKLLDRSRPAQKVKAVFDLLVHVPNEKKPLIHSMLVNLLLHRICEEELPKNQS